MFGEKERALWDELAFIGCTCKQMLAEAERKKRCPLTQISYSVLFYLKLSC